MLAHARSSSPKNLLHIIRSLVLIRSVRNNSSTNVRGRTSTVSIRSDSPSSLDTVPPGKSSRQRSPPISTSNTSQICRSMVTSVPSRSIRSWRRWTNYSSNEILDKIWRRISSCILHWALSDMRIPVRISAVKWANGCANTLIENEDFPTLSSKWRIQQRDTSTRRS